MCEVKCPCSIAWEEQRRTSLGTEGLVTLLPTRCWAARWIPVSWTSLLSILPSEAQSQEETEAAGVWDHGELRERRRRTRRGFSWGETNAPETVEDSQAQAETPSSETQLLRAGRWKYFRGEATAPCGAACLDSARDGLASSPPACPNAGSQSQDAQLQKGEGNFPPPTLEGFLFPACSAFVTDLCEDHDRPWLWRGVCSCCIGPWASAPLRQVMSPLF